jgi:hypothetical protein
MKTLERWLGPVLAGVVLALTAPADAADAGATLGDAAFLKPPEGIAAGKRKVLAFLAPPLRGKLQYVLGGLSNLTITADGGTLLGTFNGAAADPAARRVTPFGRPCLLMIEIPKSER